MIDPRYSSTLVFQDTSVRVRHEVFYRQQLPISVYRDLDHKLVRIPDGARANGINILGASGSGKTLLLSHSIVWRDFWRGIPVIFWDPFGGGIDYLLDKIARQPKAIREALWPRLRYIDMGNRDYVVPMPLYYRIDDKESLYEISQRFLGVVKKLDPQLESASIEGWNALWLIGTYTGMMLAALGFQITEADRLLRNPEAYKHLFRNALDKYPDELRPVMAFFDKLGEMPRRRLASFLTKTASFSLEPGLRAMFGASEPGIDWQEVVDRGLTVLIDFRNVTDPERRRFLMWWVFQSVVDFIKWRGTGRHQPFSFVIDELTALFSDSLAADVFADAINELINRLARQFSVWLTVSSQELYQFSETLQKTLLSMGTQILGLTRDPDAARFLAQRYQRYNPDLVRKLEPVWMSDSGMPYIVDYRTVEYTIEEQLQLAIDEFTSLRLFQFLVHIARGEGDIGGSLRKISIAGIDPGQYPNAQQVETIRNFLIQCDGQPIEEILAQVEERGEVMRAVQAKRPRRPVVETRTLHLKDQNEPEEVPVFTIDHD